MKTLIHIGDKPLTLTMSDFEDEIDVDEITAIEYHNLFGEAVTVSALLNKMGILKAKAESIYSEKKLEFDIYESTLRKRIRRESAMNGGKFTIEDEQIKLTENSLNEVIVLDKGWQVNKKNVIKSKETLDKVDALYWAVQSKDRKLSVLMKAVTPEEFFNEIIEGTVNGILIKKRKSITQR